MNQSCFTLGLLSQNSLWKLSFFCGYKEYLYWGEKRIWNVRFFKIEVAHGLASPLDWVARSSRTITEWPVVLFCPVVLQLAWRFNFWHAWHVLLLAACSRESPARLCFLAHSWAFNHSISLTTLTTNPPKYRVINWWNTSKFGTE